jgi:hypothetical protein
MPTKLTGAHDVVRLHVADVNAALECAYRSVAVGILTLISWSGELGWNHLLFVYEDYTHIPRLHIKLHRRSTPFPLSSNYASGAH